MIYVPANDHGAIYVIELNRPAPAGLADKADAAIIDVFGPVILNTDYIDVIMPGQLGEMRLVDLIRGGYEMPVSPTDEVALEGLMGTVVLVMSAAFGGNAMTINLPADVRLVTTLHETPDITLAAPLRSEGATGAIDRQTKPPKSNARIGGMIAMYALIAMFALVGLMVWIGG